MSEPTTTRIFATVEAFRLACPLCARISVVEPEGPKRRRVRARRRTRGAETYAKVRASWDGRHQVLKCAWCGIVWQIGLVVRPKASRGGTLRRERPADTVPNRKELAMLRNLYGGGWWIDEPHKGDQPVNVYEPNECACPPDPWTASCPVHGRERHD